MDVNRCVHVGLIC